MRHIAAYLLLVLGGNESPSAEDVTKLLSSVGIDADADRVGKLVGALEGKVRPGRAQPSVTPANLAAHDHARASPSRLRTAPPIAQRPRGCRSWRP